jgi:hypothetical protein
VRLIGHWEATYVYCAGQDEDQVPILTSPIFGATSRPRRVLQAPNRKSVKQIQISEPRHALTPSTPGLRFEGTRRVWPFLGMIEVRAVKAPDPEIF